jgi:hypothetical protein
MQLIVFVIVPPHLPERKDIVSNELLRVGIKDFYFVEATMAASRSVSDRDACIINSHLHCFSRYVSLRSTKHLMILEDDVEFVSEDPTRDIEDVLESLENFPWWYSLHVGHFPLGPTVPINALLAWTVLPFTSHAIIWNARRVREVLAKPHHGRPYVIEGNVHLPLFSRFSVVKSIVTQNRRPKELVDLDTNSALGFITRQFHFKTWNDAFVTLSVLSPIVLTSLILAAFWKLTLTYIMALPLLAVLFAVGHDEKKIIPKQNDDHP